MRWRPDAREGAHMLQPGRAALLATILVLAISTAGCSAPPALVIDEANSAVPTETQSAAEVAAEAARKNLRKACSKFGDSMAMFANMSSADPTAEIYGAGLKEFAFSLGDQALDAGDTGDVGLDLLLARLASETAAFADEYSVTGEVSTARWLAFRTGVKAVGDGCGQTWDFED